MAYDFDKIARTYDRLNRVMTFGLDRRWRRHAAHEVESGKCVLDVACGTGDMVLELQKHGCKVTGIDLSEEMMAIAKRKAPATYIIGDAEHLPFPDYAFDVVTCAFGVRNFVHLEQGLSEMLRVLQQAMNKRLLPTPIETVFNAFWFVTFGGCITSAITAILARRSIKKRP